MEQNEWKHIYDLYYKPMFLYALSLTNQVQDAEDLLQETFIKAFLSYHNTGSLKAWLIKVLKNEFISMIRRRKRERLDGEGNILSQVRSDEEEFLERIIQEEERRKLFLAIQKLPLRSKEILIESIYFHLEDEQIANEHQMTRENVRQIRSRAKRQLIQIMKEDL